MSDEVLEVKSISFNWNQQAPIGISLSTKHDNASLGPLVIKVIPGSIAERSGLQVDDIILEINGNKTSSIRSSQLGDLLRSQEDINLVVKPASETQVVRQRPTVKFSQQPGRYFSDDDEEQDDANDSEPIYDANPISRNLLMSRAPVDEQIEQNVPESIENHQQNSSQIDVALSNEQLFEDQQEIMNFLELDIEKMDNPRMRDILKTFSLGKSENFFGFGLNFHTERILPSLPEHKVVYPLIEVDPGSPAEDAGMTSGQRMVAVNLLFMNKDLASLEEAVESIKDSYYARETTEITVIEKEAWEEFLKNPNLAASIAQVSTRF